ncbi:MAG: hypothetical protein JSW25_03335, partial [Thermoplasmata archaeon]
MRRLLIAAMVLLMVNSALVQLPLQGPAIEENVPRVSPHAIGSEAMLPVDIRTALGEIDGGFIENHGQLSEDGIRFYAIGDPLSIGFAPDRVVFTLTGTPDQDGTVAPRSSSNNHMAVRFDMVFDGCDGVEPVGQGRLGNPTSFFLGNDPERWVRDTFSYAEVLYQGIYDGVDLRFYFKEGMFKYDFIL